MLGWQPYSAAFGLLKREHSETVLTTYLATIPYCDKVDAAMMLLVGVYARLYLQVRLAAWRACYIHTLLEPQTHSSLCLCILQSRRVIRPKWNIIGSIIEYHGDT